jgi:holliday junction DNA helicase RuvA
MLAYLRGNLVEKELTRAVIDVNGIGFELLIPMSTYDKLPRVGEELALKTYLHVRQDIMQLFGFFTDPERALFLMLISSVSGIGPKLALNVLSSMPMDVFSLAILDNNIKSLSRISGIGKRSAERLVIELKDKINDVCPEVAITGHTTSLSPAGAKAVDDSVSGLITLGFKKEAARKSVDKLIKELPESEWTPEILIRRALVILNS